MGEDFPGGLRNLLEVGSFEFLQPCVYIANKGATLCKVGMAHR